MEMKLIIELKNAEDLQNVTQALISIKGNQDSVGVTMPATTNSIPKVVEVEKQEAPVMPTATAVPVGAVQERVPKAPTAKPAAETMTTLDDVIHAAQSLAARTSNDVVRGLLSDSFGVSALKDLSKESYGRFIVEANAL